MLPRMDTVTAVDSVVSGLDLKLRRTAARVTQIDLATHMNVRAQRVSQIEALAVVRPQLVERYEAALAAVATSGKVA